MVNHRFVTAGFNCPTRNSVPVFRSTRATTEAVFQGAGLGPLELTFVPHLVPMTRGILATCYARLTRTLSPDELMAEYRAFYRDEPFVRVLENPPATKHTWGSNFCFVCPKLSPQTGRLVVTACLDNLVKGAAGQAVQNMNLMLGYQESLGLEALPIYP